jgi:hypothetical protein
MRLREHQGQSARFKEKENLSPLPKPNHDSSIVSPQAGHHTDYTISALQNNFVWTLEYQIKKPPVPTKRGTISL